MIEEYTEEKMFVEERKPYWLNLTGGTSFSGELRFELEKYFPDAHYNRSVDETFERRSSCVRGFPVASTTPDAIRAVESMEAIYIASWTRSFFPNRLETPLDDRVERLGPKFYYSKFRKF